MTTNKFKLSLNNARIPFISSFAQRAVMIPSLDYAARAPKQFSGSEENLDFNIPCVIFAQNAVPTAEGIKSASYATVIPATVNDDFDQIFPLRDADENQVLFSPAKGKNYIYDTTVPAWDDNPILNLWRAAGDPTAALNVGSIDTPATAQVTRAYVDGKTFIAYSNLLINESATQKDGSIFYWDTTTPPGTFVWVDLEDPAGLILNLPPSIVEGTINGISNSNGYLLLYSGLTIAWAPFNGVEFDFAPYAAGEFTGSGYQIPEDIKGPITAVVPVAGGFIIFSNKNAVGATYNSSNTASPWTFREIPNAGGVINYEQISVEGTLGSLFAYTSGGIQKISLNNAESAFPDATDYLGGRKIETYNSTNKVLTRSVISTEVFTKLTYLGNRFLIISVGAYPGLFSWALLYDTGLDRWGKLRVVHTDCFAYTVGVEDAQLTYSMLFDVMYSDMDDIPYDETTIESSGVTYPRQVIGFMNKYGRVQLAVIDYRGQAEDDTSESVVILGRLQLSRSAQFELQRVELEGAPEGVTCTVVPSYNGRTLGDPVELLLVEQEDDYSCYGGLVNGENFNVHVEGNFSLSTVLIEGQRTGRL